MNECRGIGERVSNDCSCRRGKKGKGVITKVIYTHEEEDVRDCLGLRKEVGVRSNNERTVKKGIK